MKKMLSIIICFALMFGLCSCSGSLVTESKNKKLSIVASAFPQYDFAKQIAGSTADVTLLLPPGAECHTYEPTPKDIIKISECDIFIYVGGESDAWIDQILDSIDTSKITLIKLLDCVATVNEETVSGMMNEEKEEPSGSEVDEHIWTSPKNAIQISSAICKQIVAQDKGNADIYNTNCQKYIGELTELDKSIEDIVAKSARKTIVFGDRFPFRYFADAYGLTYYAAFPGCSSETEPSAATLAFLIKKVKSEHIPVVFHIEMSSKSTAETICKETNAKPLLMHSCHNVSKEELANNATYLSLMKTNAENLKTALN